MYDTDPKVDSGWKTVNDGVTNANGDTAQASTEFYVILIVGRTDLSRLWASDDCPQSRHPRDR